MLVVDKDKLVHGGFLFEVEVIQAACDEVGSIYAADRWVSRVTMLLTQ